MIFGVLSTFLAAPVFSIQSSNHVVVGEVAVIVDLPAARVGSRHVSAGFLPAPVFSSQSSNRMEVSEVAVIVDLRAARAGLRQESALSARDDGARTPGALLMLTENGAKSALEGRWKLTMASALGQLPSGACLTVRDSNGREWYVGPALRATAASLGEAVLWRAAIVTTMVAERPGSGTQ